MYVRSVELSCAEKVAYGSAFLVGDNAAGADPTFRGILDKTSTCTIMLATLIRNILSSSAVAHITTVVLIENASVCFPRDVHFSSLLDGSIEEEKLGCRVIGYLHGVSHIIYTCLNHLATSKKKKK